MELAGDQWKNSTEISSILSQNIFSTLYGNIRFDENGQSKTPSLLLQYQFDEKTKEYPIEIISGEYKTADYMYPMPTWKSRDCVSNGLCSDCDDLGQCICTYSVGFGENASCIDEAEFKYISGFLVYIGFGLVCIQGIASLLCMLWTNYFKKRKAVKVSQPIFLHLIAVGCFVMTSSIIPLSVEGEYRYSYPSTGLPEESLYRTKLLDFSCVAVPWLYFIGFSLVFSALFAKIWRIRKIFEAGRSMRRVTVQIKDVMKIIIIIISINVTFLLSWSLVDPLLWKRTHNEENNMITNSVGYCSPARSVGYYMILPLIFFTIGSLIYALYISYRVREIPGELAETKWISFCVLMILELLLFGVPIILIGYLQKNKNVYYFGLSATIFLQGFAVTQFIFAPKFYYLHCDNNIIDKKERFARVSETNDSTFMSNFQTRNSTRYSTRSSHMQRSRMDGSSADRSSTDQQSSTNLESSTERRVSFTSDLK